MRVLFLESLLRVVVVQDFSTNLHLINLKNDDDLNFENIIIDKTSADLLKGSEVDYVSELIGVVTF